MDKLHNIINILDWVLNIPLVIFVIIMLKDAIKLIFIDKNYKHKFTTWSCFTCTILFITAYVAMFITKTTRSWEFLLGAIIFLYAITHKKNTKQLN